MFFQSVCFTTNQVLHFIQITLVLSIIVKNNTISGCFVIPSVYFAFHIISLFYVFFIDYIGVFRISLPVIILHIGILANSQFYSKVFQPDCIQSVTAINPSPCVNLKFRDTSLNSGRFWQRYHITRRNARYTIITRCIQH